MSPKLNRSRNQQGPPGNRLKKLAKSNRALAAILSHTHVLQIIDDHQAMWLSAESDAEKHRIQLRLRKQIMLAMVDVVGFEVAVHGFVVAIVSDPLHGGSLLIAGAAIMYLSGKGH